MKLIINQERTINEVQNDFTTFFPFLKIEFFASPHKPEEGSIGKLQFPRNLKLHEIRTLKNEGVIAINPFMITGELEQVFHKEYGLNVQVFRNMNGIWIQSTNSDHLTLLAQNEMGQSSQLIKKSRPEIEERDF